MIFLRGLDGFFDSDDRAKMVGIFMTEPYDPERIPILMIHGLVSVPIIWRDIIPRIGVDPDLSKRYQLLVFAYQDSPPARRASVRGPRSPGYRVIQISF